MNSKISSEYLCSNIDLAKHYILKNLQTDIKTIEFRTMDEGFCAANYFICSKKYIDDEFEALVTLLNTEIHFYEEWKLSETDASDINNILKNFFIPEWTQLGKFQQLSPKEAEKEIDWIVGGIKILIENVTPITLGYPSRWGVYVNNKIISNDAEFTPFDDAIRSAFGLDLEWNSKEIFLETDSEFILFSWGTGA